MAQVATNRTVARAELLDFVRSRHRTILSTRRSDGTEQLSPVTAGVDAAGHIVIATYPQRAKVRNVRKNPAASVCVLSDEWNGPWVQVTGTADVIDLPEALDAFIEYYRSIAGEHPDWEEYRVAMAKQGKCLIRMAVAAWGPIATGGFPPEVADR